MRKLLLIIILYALLQSCHEKPKTVSSKIMFVDSGFVVNFNGKVLDSFPPGTYAADRVFGGAWGTKDCYGIGDRYFVNYLRRHPLKCR